MASAEAAASCILRSRIISHGGERREVYVPSAKMEQSAETFDPFTADLLLFQQPEAPQWKQAEHVSPPRTAGCSRTPTSARIVERRPRSDPVILAAAARPCPCAWGKTSCPLTRDRLHPPSTGSKPRSRHLPLSNTYGHKYKQRDPWSCLEIRSHHELGFAISSTSSVSSRLGRILRNKIGNSSQQSQYVGKQALTHRRNLTRIPDNQPYTIPDIQSPHSLGMPSLPAAMCAQICISSHSVVTYSWDMACYYRVTEQRYVTALASFLYHLPALGNTPHKSGSATTSAYVTGPTWQPASGSALSPHSCDIATPLASVKSMTVNRDVIHPVTASAL
ncbi:paired box protein Pax-9 [Lates japonicus]|uniref:Paired box protein Pax-9 n=1 Tax=Lates japonicus TaxID=270547 RepID=A0AAD3RM69_LATJO|nr:paired box protein Pax-9 [Lates japonicus]